MRIAHVALWTADIDRLCAFWAETFGATAGALYESTRRPGFRSRFINLEGGTSIEVMHGPWIETVTDMPERAGYAHLALALSSHQAVDDMAQKAAARNILVSAPRMTGDGFYEAVLRDPDGNFIEITI